MHKLNALIPELSVSDIEQSLNFYSEILLFKIEYQ
ncbi:aldoketomutase, partial [Bacillus anthracis]